MEKWIKFEDELPSNELGMQVDILLGHPNWATYFRGLYTHFNLPLSLLGDCLSEYDQSRDKFISWEHKLPTHWMRLPKNPE